MENLLSLLPILACPVVMGVMMWMMMRGTTGQATGPGPEPTESVASRAGAEPVRSAAVGGTRVAPSVGASLTRMIGGICLNWKVVAGLAAVGLAIFVVAPNLVGLALPILIVAACPLSMLLMMRGGRAQQCAVQPTEATPPGVGELSREERLAAFKSQLASTRARQDALGREIGDLETFPTPAAQEAGAASHAAREYDRGSA